MTSQLFGYRMLRSSGGDPIDIGAPAVDSANDPWTTDEYTYINVS